MESHIYNKTNRDFYLPGTVDVVGVGQRILVTSEFTISTV